MFPGFKIGQSSALRRVLWLVAFHYLQLPKRQPLSGRQFNNLLADSLSVVAPRATPIVPFLFEVKLIRTVLRLRKWRKDVGKELPGRLRKIGGFPNFGG